MQGFIFEKNGKYYFIESARKKRNKADAQIIMDYFTSRLYNEGKTFTIEVLRKTHELIQKEMYWAKVRHEIDYTIPSTIEEDEQEIDVYDIYSKNGELRDVIHDYDFVYIEK